MRVGNGLDFLLSAISVELLLMNLTWSLRRSAFNVGRAGLVDDRFSESEVR